jgi:putrescine carbamoyltransferase
MCDVIEARTLEHQTVLDLARYAEVPVINGLTDYNHPTQALCDVVTMGEHLPPGKRLEDLTVVFVGDATNVCSSTMLITTRLGMNFVHAAPAAYQAPETWRHHARANCAASGGTLSVTDDVESAVEGADVVYTDLWWWVGQEDEVPDRRAAFMPRYQVNEKLMAIAPTHTVFMHCLPASRGVEVTDGVIDGKQSIVFDQAENRLHAEKAILAWTVWPTLGRAASPELRARHRGLVEATLSRCAPSTGTPR